MTGLSLPGWLVVVLAAFVVVVCALAFIRGSTDGRSELAIRFALVLIFALTGIWALDHLAGRDLAAERQALEARAFELHTRALAPGSALTCLDAIAGEAVEEACEKALFASPDATAAAVSYVAAQVSLLADANDRARGGPRNGTLRANLRRAIEADRFGIVAHVLAVRDGCTPDRCGAFVLLRDVSRVSANLAERKFESHLKSNMAGWPAATGRTVAGNPPATATAPAASGVAGAKPSDNLYFPSSSSIPPVSIMTAEPPPSDTVGAAEATATTRKPPQPNPRPPAAGAINSGPSRPAPLQLAPGSQQPDPASR